MTHVLQPLEPPYDPPVEAALAGYPRGRHGELLSLFRVFAQSPRFVGGRGVVNLLDAASPLSLRERELVILRVTARLNCEYEWGVHVAAFASAAGLTREQVAATRLAEASDPCWPADDAMLLGCIDALCSTGTLPDALREAFQARWTVEEQLELLALCGNYRTVALVANVAVLPPEPFAARFPEPAEREGEDGGEAGI